MEAFVLDTKPVDRLRVVFELGPRESFVSCSDFSGMSAFISKHLGSGTGGPCPESRPVSIADCLLSTQFFVLFELVCQHVPNAQTKACGQLETSFVGQQDEHIVCAIQQHRTLATLFQMHFEQAPHPCRHVVIEIIRNFPADFCTTERDHGRAFPTAGCPDHERDTK